MKRTRLTEVQLFAARRYARKRGTRAHGGDENGNRSTFSATRNNPINVDVIYIPHFVLPFSRLDSKIF